MSIEVPDNARGPILDLTLPASEDAIDIVLRNKTTGKQLTLNLPEGWDGTDLSLDWRLRTITGATGVDRSALLDPEDNELWAAAEPFSGNVDVEVEALAMVESVEAAPGTIVSDLGDLKAGAVAWSNPSNAKASDDIRATASSAGTWISEYLKATDYGFVIPAGAHIVGIEPAAERSTGAQEFVEDLRVRLVIGGELRSSDKPASGSWPPIAGAEETVKYGGQNDLWGEEPSVADVTGEGFGFVLAVEGNGKGVGEARVDYMPMTVYYRPVVAFSAKAALRWEKGYY